MQANVQPSANCSDEYVEKDMHKTTTTKKELYVKTDIAEEEIEDMRNETESKIETGSQIIDTSSCPRDASTTPSSKKKKMKIKFLLGTGKKSESETGSNANSCEADNSTTQGSVKSKSKKKLLNKIKLTSPRSILKHTKIVQKNAEEINSKKSESEIGSVAHSCDGDKSIASGSVKSISKKKLLNKIKLTSPRSKLKQAKSAQKSLEEINGNLEAINSNLTTMNKKMEDDIETLRREKKDLDDELDKSRRELLDRVKEEERRLMEEKANELKINEPRRKVEEVEKVMYHNELLDNVYDNVLKVIDPIAYERVRSEKGFVEEKESELEANEAGIPSVVMEYQRVHSELSNFVYDNVVNKIDPVVYDNVLKIIDPTYEDLQNINRNEVDKSELSKENKPEEHKCKEKESQGEKNGEGESFIKDRSFGESLMSIIDPTYDV